MKILILGGSGYLGARLAQFLRQRLPQWQTLVAARHIAAGEGSVKLDTLDAGALATALDGVDCVVNCVAGGADAIGRGAAVLAQAAQSAGCARIVHLSTMSVYGAQHGLLREDASLDPGLGWYGAAKCEAERHVRAFSAQGGRSVILRPGCIGGPGSELWVGRIGRWLCSSRLGELGAAGDGWSNLVHVDDVCQVIAQAVARPMAEGACDVFNVAAPDSPRWGAYFVDLGVAIGATPVKRISARQLKLDAMLLGPPLKIAERLARAAGLRQPGVPDAISPGLLRLWAQPLQLDVAAATRELAVEWTPYQALLEEGAQWFTASRARAAAH